MTARSQDPNETTRMFESDFLERFSHVHPATPFIAYVPLVAWLVYRCVFERHTGLLMLPLVFAGLLLWTLTEYVLHRWVFHWNNGSKLSARVHFLLHGVHHDFPNDKTRLVMPLGASIPIAIIFYALIPGLLGKLYGEPLYIGMAIGYLFYDGTHYAVHHFKQRTRIGKALRKHHMVHHFADHEGGFGVSSPLWDYVFGTLPKKKTSAAT